MYKNIDTWSFDLAGRHWAQLSAVDWQRWTMFRVDRGPNGLYDVRQALWHRDHGWPGLELRWVHAEAPDFDALGALYRIDTEAPVPEAGQQNNVFRTVIDGVTVRFTEERYIVHAMVEGRLSAERLNALRCQTLATLERLDGSPWEVDES